MSSNHGSERRVKAGSKDVERFQEKFLRGASKGMKVIEEQSPSVFEKLRLRVAQNSKSIWRWGAGNPAKEQDRVSYKVRGGKLTVTDDEGRVIKTSDEKGLNKYNGMTLQGKENRKGEMVVKENQWNHRKLEEGNVYLTPQERKDQKPDWAVKLIGRVYSFGEKIKRKKKGDNVLVNKIASHGHKLYQATKKRSSGRRRKM